MSVLTPFFNLFKPAKTDPLAVSKLNDNMDIIDTEMHRPPLTVNEIEPDPTTRNISVTTVPLADNLTSDEAQIIVGTFIERTSGGDASISNGSAWISDIKGNMVKTGYVAQSVEMTVSPTDPSSETAIDATIDENAFIAEMTNTSGTMTFSYTSSWSVDPASYGITVTGTPVSGDSIVVDYVKENRGTITTANPTSFLSTGWNLYNHAVGYAKVIKYSDVYGFMIAGTYTSLKFAATLTGDQTVITPVDGYFTIPSDGYLIVTGGNNTDTEIWMTWSDWTEEANSGTFEAYSSTSIDLSGVMVNFPYGLLRVGNIFDEINLNVGKAYSRIERLEYNTTNLNNVIASGVSYETDSLYIYAVRVEPISYTISLDGEYTVSDHGMEFFVGTSVALTASVLYGNDLKGKLRRDVVTISEQELTTAQQTQVRENIGAASLTDVNNAGYWKIGDVIYVGRVIQGVAIGARSIRFISETAKMFPSGVTLDTNYTESSCRKYDGTNIISSMLYPPDIYLEDNKIILDYLFSTDVTTAGTVFTLFMLTSKPLTVTVISD